MFRNYPEEGDWWIGLLMLDPDERGRGLGSEIVCSASAWADKNRPRSIMLAVLESDAAARRFWERQGSAEVRRRAYQFQAAKKNHTVIVMRRATVRVDAT